MPDAEPNLEEVKKQCIFCHIVAGRVASKKVYDEQKINAVLDINPANPGHILVLPKVHYSIMPQIPDEEIGDIGMNLKSFSSVLLRALKCHGTTIFIANGVAAGQRAQHFMAHVIPRMDDDGLNIELPEKKIASDKLIEIKNLLIPSVKKLLGKAAEPSPIVEKKDAGKNEDVEKNESSSNKGDLRESPKKSASTDLDDIARLLGQ